MWMPFLHKFVNLKELTAEGLTDSSWNTLENIKRPRERETFPQNVFTGIGSFLTNSKNFFRRIFSCNTHLRKLPSMTNSV